MWFIKSWIIVIYITLTLISVIVCDYHHQAKIFDENTQEQAVRDLIKRLLPESDEDKFVIIVDFGMNKNGKDAFEIQVTNKIYINASSGVAAAAGFHHYLKYFCAAHVSWDFHQLNLTKCQQSDVQELIEFNDKYRFYQNACTPSYSFVWWDWDKWEEHIDWLAMQGFNLVPAMNGQEGIWKRVYEELGMTQQEIDEHFTGPAFLSWNRMGNLRAFGGPLSSEWHKKQMALNSKIVIRMREFGITTVLPAFAGQVPRALVRLYPNATYYDLPCWNDFDDIFAGPYLLDPTDKLFQRIGSIYLNKVIKEFGTDHIYSCDTFNEMTPFTTDLNELRQISQAIFSTMTSVDPQAIWLLQGWLFHHEVLYWTKKRAKALLTSIPIGKMIILDLQSEQFPQYERLDNYFGQPYIWCMLHNFGGTLGMFGSAEIINNKIFEARAMNASTLIGTGITPEGIDQNYVIYDLMTEMAWRKSPANLSLWFKDYSTRRYGQENENIAKVWDILSNTVYSYNSSQLMRGKFVYNRSPRTNFLPWTWYSHGELQNAWTLFYNEGAKLSSNRNFRHDSIDLGRQVLQNLADNIYVDMMQAFKIKEIETFRNKSQIFMSIFNSIELLLSQDEKYLLGIWLNASKQNAHNEREAALFENNARNQITLWGPNGQIKDYANKQWSGIVEDFFKPRWELFIEHMNDSLNHDIKFNENGARMDVFEKVELPFTYSRKTYPVKPTGNFGKIFKQIAFEIETLITFSMTEPTNRGGIF